MKTFEKWETEEVERTFGLVYHETLPEMKAWIAFQQDLTEREQETIEDLRTEMKYYADFWNEEDIKVFFLMPLINMVRFRETGKYRTFMEASLKAELLDAQNNPCLLSGRVEMLVATGKQRPQTPFFFMNEYKPQIKAQADPKGQLLSAMLAAQAKNNGLNLPIYGLYNIGQFVFFVVLVGKTYTNSQAFDMTDALDLKCTVNMLQFVKAHIERNL